MVRAAAELAGSNLVSLQRAMTGAAKVAVSSLSTPTKRAKTSSSIAVVNLPV